MNLATEYVLAIDGGGTRTRAWIVRFDGLVLARGEAGPSNVYELGIDQSRRVIVEAAQAAWRQSGLPGDKPCAFLAIFAGVAGAGGPEQQRALASALAAEFGVSPGSTRVDHDLRIALAGALAGEPGVVLLAGTGAAAYGRGITGEAAKSGGWGALLDDGGGGTWIGLQAMRLVVRVADGRAQPTRLAEAVLGQLNAANPRELLHRLQPSHGAPLQRAEIAALAPLVIVAAATGDAAANKILQQGAQELAEMAAAVMHRINHGGSDRLRLAAAGGLLENNESYFELVAEAVRKKLSSLILERAQLPPVAGAALLALELAGQPRTPEIVERLRAEPAGVAGG